MDIFDRKKAKERIDSYSGLEDGWVTSDSLGPSGNALAEATEFVDALSRAGVKYQPGISLDTSIGAFLFDWFSHWNGRFPLPKGELKVDVSLYNDGTYSFYAQHKDIIARSNSENINHIHPGLKNLINNAYD